MKKAAKPVIEIILSKSQIKLLLARDVLDLDYEEKLKLPIRKGDTNIINLEPYELEDLCGTVAFMGNHGKNQKMVRKYDRLFEYLNDYLDDYYRKDRDE